MQILHSLSYINRYPDNRVTDGQRMLSIVAIDTGGADSSSISVDITVMDRNDGPVVDVGGGDSMDIVTTFVENGPSVPIGTCILCHSKFKVPIANIVELYCFVYRVSMLNSLSLTHNLNKRSTSFLSDIITYVLTLTHTYKAII